MKFAKYGLSLLVIISTFSLVRTIVETRLSLRKVEELRREVGKIKERASLLEKEVGDKSTPEYLEREARDKLGLIRKGERVVILPDSVLGSAKDESETPPGKTGEIPNWKKWKKFLLE